jgi:hypothetical protein
VSRDEERNTRKITKRQIIFAIIFNYFHFPIFTNGKIVRIVRLAMLVFCAKIQILPRETFLAPAQ